MSHSYSTKGTCSKKITFDLCGDVVRNITFTGGCHGNLQAIARILDGCTVEQIEEKCRGTKCGQRETSCADQLAYTVRKAYNRACGGKSNGIRATEA